MSEGGFVESPKTCRACYFDSIEADHTCGFVDVDVPVWSFKTAPLPPRTGCGP